MPVEMQPNFLIVGAAKSGTTSLATNLRTHPQVYLHPGEVHFFSDDQKWSRGMDGYRAIFEPAPADAVAVGEKSPSYLSSEVAPERIATELTGTGRFCCIAILREPVARASSHVAHRQRRNVEPRTAVQALADNLGGEVGAYDYLGPGHYATQLRRYIDALGPEALHVEFYEDLARDPDALFGRLCERLGLRPFAFKQAARRINESATIRYPRLYRELIRVRAGRWLPSPTARWVWGKLQVPVAYEPLPDELQRRLREHFAPANEELERLLGRPLPEEWSRPDASPGRGPGQAGDAA